MRVGGFEPGAISGSVSPSLGRYRESAGSSLGRYRESAGSSLGRYERSAARAWGDTRVGGLELGAIRESAGSSLGRYRESAGSSLGRYESRRARARYRSRRARARGDTRVGGLELGAIPESVSSLGRYRGRHFRLVLREDAWSYDVRGAERRGAGLETGVPSRLRRPDGVEIRGRGVRVVGVRGVATCAARSAARAG